jgi:deoxyribodipyrimidine photolyase-related protein
MEIFGKKKRFLLFDFYKQQRKKTGWLMAGEEPLGGVWSLDAENRRKLPKGHVAPLPWFPSEDDYVAEAKEYVAQHFPDAFGEVKSFYFPIHRKDALQVLQDFVENRLPHYGEYQDAIDGKQSWVYHSVLTPALNNGLLSPHEVCQTVIDFYDKNSHLPLNAVEGFIRQVLGWREYIRAIYVVKGKEERTKNFWQFKRKIPASWWQGTTGIPPVDDVIQKIQQTGYAHHIERLMVLGNFMCLCEFDPDEVHAWFMALFIDAYDWVMVPNVYGMSQYADGGIMSTKPYISGSNYIHKMSHYPKGAWSEVWDALFWRFIFQHRSFFLSNPRLSMMVRTLEKMPEAKQRAFIDKAEQYLINLDSAGEIS